ncbi:hypothetical protein BgiBS90_009971 [Biomphalaria glabrata]|nr:hypothetical protein BgiBS90_009971 [Biomphalaria glabrata]
MKAYTMTDLIISSYYRLEWEIWVKCVTPILGDSHQHSETKQNNAHASGGSLDAKRGSSSLVGKGEERDRSGRTHFQPRTISPLFLRHLPIQTKSDRATEMFLSLLPLSTGDDPWCNCSGARQVLAQKHNVSP